jgi:uncharacterized OB-fold protein
VTSAGPSAATRSAAVSFRPGLLELGAGGGGHLVGSRCGACDACFFPPRQVCSRCLAESLEPAALSTRGTVHTYTVVHQAAPEFEVPYALGYVDLPEGVRVLGQITGVAPEAVCIGMEVELSLEPFGENDEGQEVIGYRFRPAAGEERR